jgi:TorA maturation chaperone TorD
MIMKNDSLLEALGARKAIYDFLALVFRKEADEAFLLRLRETRFLDRLNEQGYAFDPGCLEPIDDRLVKALAKEYTRVFLGPGPHLAPYESVHNPKDPKRGRLWGDSTVDVKKMIEFYGLRFEGEDYHGIPDHIAIEFEFMVRLIEKEVEHKKKKENEGAANCRRIQKRFYKDHLSVWIPGFCEELIARARSNFYKQIGLLTRDFMQFEGEYLLDDSGETQVLSEVNSV